MRALVLAVLLAGCPKATEVESPVADQPAESSAQAPTASAQLETLLAEAWDERLAMDPEMATYLGDMRNADQWSAPTAEQDEKRVAHAEGVVQRIRTTIDLDALTEQERMTVRLLEADTARAREGLRWRDHSYVMTGFRGPHSGTPAFLINIHQVNKAKDAEDYIARLRGVQPLVEQLIAESTRRQELGVVPPAFNYPQMLDACRNVITGAPYTDGEDSALRADIRGKIQALKLDREAEDALLQQADDALVQHVKPAYEALIAHLEAQAKVATDDDGAWKLPDGGAYYAYRLKTMTTTDLTPDEIHQLGLDEVARIHGEMEAIREQVGFEGDLQAFFEHLRTDEQFFYPNTDEGRQAYLDEATRLIDDMRERLPELFHTLPKADIQVKRVEPYREKAAGKAFYNTGAPDGSRAGTYYANLYDMRQMPKYQMAALAYHEGIPGHHMQLSIAQELDGLPMMRKYLHYTAWSEGWGLYSEWVPKDIGLYEDPYSDFGRLAMELWRACRLVVDSGIHHKQWTRQQAIDYLLENTPNPEGDAIKAIDRYIVTPGQATAYKVGMIEILRLRRDAEARLGDTFDVRGFHDVLLKNGPVPLDVMGELVEAWVVEQGG